MKLEMNELDLTAAEKKATYEEIKDYVLKHTGLKVSNFYIAQVKQKCDIIEQEINIDDVILSNWGKVDVPFVSYYGTISAATVGEWYKNFGNALFAKNIRFFKGNTDVNEGMKKVLLQEPEKFLFTITGLNCYVNLLSEKQRTVQLMQQDYLLWRAFLFSNN